MTIPEFLANYHANPAARIKLRDAHHTYLASLAERHRSLWPRWRFSEAVAEHLPVGRDSDGVLYIGGISTNPPSAWVVDDAGRLRLVTQ